ncbi:MAG: phosphotransferase [Candidatus Protochlamydia sp.]|nr:phosphotransferase [Candidatus Protochlamydia sp.]
MHQVDNLILKYQERLDIKKAFWSRIDHEDAMVATVYKIVQSKGNPLILKICSRLGDYFREVFFLNHFAGLLPVPRIMKTITPEPGMPGAILMECLPGRLLQKKDFTKELAYETGVLLARIHLDRVAGYGDLIEPHNLCQDPRVPFTLKFEEGLEECRDHLPKELFDQCRLFFDKHIQSLTTADGPRIIHRDFRAGNVIVHEGKIKGVIDWSSARGSFAEEDFCPIEHGEWPTNSINQKSFLAGYASVRPIPVYSSIMPLLRLNRAIAIIGFLVKRGTWESSNSQIYQNNRTFLESLIKNAFY